MFRNCGVEDAVGPVLGKYLLHPFGVRHIGDHRHHIQLRMRFAELQVNEVEGAFRLLDEHQTRWTEHGHLPRQLRADGACAARNQHHLAGKVRIDELQIEIDRCAPQQILDLHRAKLTDSCLPVDQLAY